MCQGVKTHNGFGSFKKKKGWPEKLGVVGIYGWWSELLVVAGESGSGGNGYNNQQVQVLKLYV